MALRVLLADESSTIKKAIQMVLSEYGVEVKTVPTGIDVLSVTQSYFPDVILADILLNKKNGYEVCLELKSNDVTKDIPVILMWSSFMQLDEQLFKNSKANASLEKPFETETIQALIEKLVPKLQTFPLKGFLNHAPIPDFEESDTFVTRKTINSMTQQTVPTKSESTPAPYIINEPTSHKTKLPPSPTIPPVREPTTQKNNQLLKSDTKQQSESDDWSSTKTNQFVIETENFGEFEEVKVINARDEETPDLQKEINEQISTYLKDSPVATLKAQASSQQKNAYSSFDEQLMKEEIRQTAERICWQVIPEIAERVVRDELSKLLQGIENSL